MEQSQHSSRRERIRSRYLAAALAVTAVVLCAPASALADAASIDFLDAAGHSDPVAGIGRTYVLSGSSATAKHIFVSARPSGGAPCAPSYKTDSGDTVVWDGASVNGSFRLTHSGVWESPGSYQFCIWIASNYDTPTTPFSQIVTFRAPTGSISGITSPLSPLAGQRARLGITGASEGPAKVYATVRRAGGAPCAPSYKDDSGQSLVDGESVNGAFSTGATVTQSKAGTYIACLWLADNYDDPTPYAGPQPVTFRVRTPCHVPRVTRKMELGNAKAALRRAHCGVGSVKYRYSRHRGRGLVIGFNWVSGKHLGPGTPITVTVSKGRRHRRRR